MFKWVVVYVVTTFVEYSHGPAPHWENGRQVVDAILITEQVETKSDTIRQSFKTKVAAQQFIDSVNRSNTIPKERIYLYDSPPTITDITILKLDSIKVK